MKNLSTLLLTILMMTQLALAQSITPQVIATSGAYFIASNGYSLSQTVGEMAMVETFSANNTILTQGFQQPDEKSEILGENPVSINSGNVSLYPNPAMNNVNLNYAYADAGQVKVTIYNLLGDIVRTPQVLAFTPNSANTTSISTASFPAAVYFIEVDYVSAKDNSHQVNNLKLTVIK